MRRSFLSNELIGDCIDLRYFQIFDSEGAYTLGLVDRNACAPEIRAISTCQGRWRQTGPTLTLSCDSAASRHPHSLESLELGVTADVDADEFSLSSYAPTNDRRWVGEVTAQWRFAPQLGGETFAYSHLVTIRPRTSLDFSGNVIMDILITLRSPGVDETVNLSTNANLDLQASGGPLLSFVEPDEGNPNRAWQARLSNRLGPELAAMAATALPAQLRLTDDGWLVAVGDRPVGATGLPSVWRSTDDLCAALRSDPVTPGFDAVCPVNN